MAPIDLALIGSPPLLHSGGHLGSQLAFGESCQPFFCVLVLGGQVPFRIGQEFGLLTVEEVDELTKQLDGHGASG
jgi:hypothetical protein